MTLKKLLLALNLLICANALAQNLEYDRFGNPILDPNNKTSWDVLGEIEYETRVFPEEVASNTQEDTNISPSLKIQPEIIFETAENDYKFTLSPFFRVDSIDDNRTHFDLREFSFLYQGSDWRFVWGLENVFWGVAESNHLVDIINQRDIVEDIDGEEKLGQPMLNLTLEKELGVFDFFVLPYFRERTFPSPKARLRSILPISKNTQYESSQEQSHVDYALRYSNNLGPLDLGLSSFWGTNREPRFIPSSNSLGDPLLIPYYDIINQQSIDAQLTFDSILFKFEGISREQQNKRFYAYVGGFEYTSYGIFNSKSDLGLLVEYHNDNRNPLTSSPTVFQNDIFAGLRYSANDLKSTTLLLGATEDLDNSQEVFLIAEASRRLNSRFLLEFESRWFINPAEDSFLYGFRKDSYFSIIINYFL